MEEIEHIKKLLDMCKDDDGEYDFVQINITCEDLTAIDRALNRLEQDERLIDKLEEKLMYALSPTNGELAIVTKQNLKKIIRQNIDQDTYTIKRELKKYWKDEVNYFGKKCE